MWTDREVYLAKSLIAALIRLGDIHETELIYTIPICDSDWKWAEELISPMGDADGFKARLTPAHRNPQTGGTEIVLELYT